jgi:hypothetical protein
MVLPVKEPTPASFTLSSLDITPGEVNIDEKVNISIRVENTGETEGTCQVTCMINGKVEEEKEVLLQGLSSDTVVFTITFEEAGKKRVEINDLLSSVIVKGEELILEQIPLPADVKEPSPSDHTAAEIPGQNTPEDPSSKAGGYWWFVGLILGVCALLIAVVLFFNRRRRGTSDNLS